MFQLFLTFLTILICFLNLFFSNQYLSFFCLYLFLFFSRIITPISWFLLAHFLFTFSLYVLHLVLVYFFIFNFYTCLNFSSLGVFLLRSPFWVCDSFTNRAVHYFLIGSTFYFCVITNFYLELAMPFSHFYCFVLVNLQFCFFLVIHVIPNH